jgi:hypothetical protein
VRHDAQYLIEPRTDLAAWLAERVDSDLADILCEPVVLVNLESDRSDWTPQDRMLAIKLVYLASLRQYTGLDTDAGLESAFGSTWISVALFDRWWTLRLLPASDRTGDLRQFVTAHLGSIQRTGNELVDSWLESSGPRETRRQT